MPLAPVKRLAKRATARLYPPIMVVKQTNTIWPPRLVVSGALKWCTHTLTQAYAI